ncbi:MAG: hypothetical protein VB031_09530 [Eubacteriaceae bacterium]|nr:hypothetical protein [Eubacteriaceae bacterium]
MRKRNILITVAAVCILACALTAILVRAHRFEDMSKYTYDNRKAALKSAMTTDAKGTGIAISSFTKDNTTYYLASYPNNNCVIAVTEKYDKYKGERISPFYRSKDTSVTRYTVKDKTAGITLHVIYGRSQNDRPVTIGSSPAKLYDDGTFGYIGEKDLDVYEDD